MSTQSFAALYHPSYVPSANWTKVQVLFWDRIFRIVPANMQSQFGDEYIDEVFNVDPDILPMLSPRPSDLDEFDRYRVSLERALARISRERRSNRRDSDFFGINPSKAPAWLFKTLDEFDLIKKDYEDHGSWLEPHHWIQEDAGYLIMSMLSSFMARRRGLGQVTDRAISFYVTAAQEISEYQSDRSDSSMEGALGMAVFHIFVPKNIDELSFQQVFKLRNEYADLRNAFHKTVRRVSKEHNLEGIVDQERAKEAVYECIREFLDEERKFNKGSVRRALSDWRVQSIGVMLGGLGAAIAGGPVAGIAFTMGGTTIALANALVDHQELKDFEKSIKYLHILNRGLRAMGCVDEVRYYLP